MNMSYLIKLRVINSGIVFKFQKSAFFIKRFEAVPTNNGSIQKLVVFETQKLAIFALWNLCNSSAADQPMVSVTTLTTPPYTEVRGNLVF